jgi:hypothetical protein
MFRTPGSDADRIISELDSRDLAMLNELEVIVRERLVPCRSQDFERQGNIGKLQFKFCRPEGRRP